MDRRKFVVTLGGLAGLALLPLGCGGDRVLAGGFTPTPTPTPSPTPTPAPALTPKDGENLVEAALLDTCARFRFEPMRMGGQLIYAVYGASGGIASSSIAMMLRAGNGHPPTGYLYGGDLGLAPLNGHEVTNAGNGWAHVGIRWTKQAEYSNGVAAYIELVKELFEEAAEALVHTV